VTRLDLHNPHGFLGAHPAKGGVVVRAFRPAAQSVTVQPHGVELHETEEGIWEGVVEGADLPLSYELEVVYFFNMVADHPFGTLAILDKIEFELFVIVQREIKISLHSGK